MEVAGLVLAVAVAFKDVYFTAQFIKKTAHSMTHYRTEQSDLVIHFEVQIIRLQNFSRLFRGADGSVDEKLLRTVPEVHLSIVHRVLHNLEDVLKDYRFVAERLDNNYLTQSLQTPYDSTDTSKVAQHIEDATAPDTSAQDVSKEQKKPAATTGKKWSFLWFGKGSSSQAKSAPKQSGAIRNNLNEKFQWLFTKGKLTETLNQFKNWNDDLEYLIPTLLDGFGFLHDPKLQQRLRPDGEIDLFGGHIELTKLARSEEKFKVQPISWEEAEIKKGEPRTVVERKQSGLTNEQVKGIDPSVIAQVKELYAPQLAQLLSTAGKHHFRTLPFEAYAWDSTGFQYAFLFKYPPDAANVEPKSLNDVIRSADSKFRLELKDRFRVAQTLAQAIGAFHSDGWLHKSISSHAVKFFFLDEETCDFSSPYLTNFEFSRPEGGVTRRSTVAVDTEQDIYRHPDRYGLPAGFSKIHDIFSFGVVLLEIGLWQTAKQMYDSIIKDGMGGKAPKEGVSAQIIKDVYIRHAKARLSHRMGLSYQEAVIACLEGRLDEYIGQRDFTDEFQKQVVQKVDIKAMLS